MDPEAHVPLPGARDEIGLIRAITVKVNIASFDWLLRNANSKAQECSSAKRKAMFKETQVRVDKSNGVARTPQQLLLDMKVRWSSTYVMCDRAEKCKEVSYLLFYLTASYSCTQYIDEFLMKMALEEKDKDARQRIHDLALSEEEWKRVDLFIGLLAVCHFIYSVSNHLLRYPEACRSSPASILLRACANTTPRYTSTRSIASLVGLQVYQGEVQAIPLCVGGCNGEDCRLLR
jgi:hypothetical protein